MTRQDCGGEHRLTEARGLDARCAPPGVSVPDRTELENAEVKSSDGDQIGRIERIAIDVDRGRVAYVLVGQGGFLGLGQRYLPVPFEKLTFDGPNAVTVQSTRKRLMHLRTYDQEDIPSTVSTQEMRRLYKAHGLEDYFWREPMAQG